ncbi:hypothetical protein [Xanthomonas citri]|nr:hypothetical protein [Xanthomonas citri]
MWTTTVVAYAELMEAGMSGHFWLSHGERGIGYVAAKLSGYGTQVVARLIASAGIGQQVAYRDGNRLNLRPDNLVLENCRHARSPSSLILQVAKESSHMASLSQRQAARTDTSVAAEVA